MFNAYPKPSMSFGTSTWVYLFILMRTVLTDDDDDDDRCSDLPGVIERVPFSRVGIATVGCVVTAHSGA